MGFFESLPTACVVEVSTFVDASVEKVPVLNEVIAPLVFLFVLATAHNLRRSVHLFLDICCIPQDDEQKKTLGISSLGSILDRSEKMLILMDEHYWQRLWCVFEVAAFYRRSGRRRMVIVPVHLALLKM